MIILNIIGLIFLYIFLGTITALVYAAAMYYLGKNEYSSFHNKIKIIFIVLGPIGMITIPFLILASFIKILFYES